MSFIITSKTRAIGNRAPIGRVSLNRTSPQFRGIQHYWLMGQGSDALVKDLAGNNDATGTGAGAALIHSYDSGYGQRALYKDTNQRRLSIPAITLPSGTEWTIGFRASRRTTGGVSDGMVLGDSSDLFNFIWLYEANMFRVRMDGTDFDWTSDTSFRRWRTYHITARVSGANTTLELWIDGISQGTVGPLTNRSLLINSLFSGYSNYVFALDGALSWVGIWGYAWGDAMVRANYASQTRFDLFDTRKRTYFIPAPAPATSVFIITSKTRGNVTPRWPYRVHESQFGADLAYTFANYPKPTGLVSHTTRKDVFDLSISLSPSVVPRGITTGRYGAHLGADLNGSGFYLRTLDLPQTLVEKAAWSREYIVTLHDLTLSRAIHTVAEAPASTTRDRGLNVDNAAPRFRAYIYDGAAKEAICTEDFVANRQYHVVITASAAAGLNIYQDGVLKATTAVSNGGYTEYSTPLHLIGLGGPDAESTGNGVISLLREYPTVLSAGQIGQLYERPWSNYDGYARKTYFLPSTGPSAGTNPFNATGLSAATTYYAHYYQVNGNEYSNVQTSDAFSTILLSNPTAADITSSAATVGSTLNTAGGTLYTVVTESATPPTPTQIKAGQDDLGAAAKFADTIP
jgi:hypothetical protein